MSQQTLEIAVFQGFLFAIPPFFTYNIIGGGNDQFSDMVGQMLSIKSLF
jgi:hypothetical protein